MLIRISHFVICLSVIALLFCSALAQNAKNSSSWRKIDSEKELTLSLPYDYNGFVDEEGFNRVKHGFPLETIRFTDLRSLIAYENGAALTFERYKVKDPKENLAVLLADEAFREKPTDAKIRDFKVGNFLARQTINESATSFFMTFHIASDKYVYFIAGGARGKNNGTLIRFLNSIRLEGQQLLPQGIKDESDSLESVSVSDVQTTALTVTFEERKKERDAEKTKPDSPKPTGEIIPGVSQAVASNINKAPKPDTLPLVILRQVKPGYTESARRNNVDGVVRLKMVFSASGKVTGITVVSGLSNGLTENTIKAARRLLFLPEERSGAPISKTRVVEYGFKIY